jgi:hypothetical protein
MECIRRFDPLPSADGFVPPVPKMPALNYLSHSQMELKLLFKCFHARKILHLSVACG